MGQISRVPNETGSKLKIYIMLTKHMVASLNVNYEKAHHQGYILIDFPTNSHNATSKLLVWITWEWISMSNADIISIVKILYFHEENGNIKQREFKFQKDLLCCSILQLRNVRWTFGLTGLRNSLVDRQHRYIRHLTAIFKGS